MLTVQGFSANTQATRFSGKVDLEASLNPNAPMTLTGVKDAVDTFLSSHRGVLAPYEAVGPDVHFSIHRHWQEADASRLVTLPSRTNAPQNPFALTIEAVDTTNQPQDVMPGIRLNQSTRHQSSVTLGLVEKAGQIYMADMDHPTEVLPLTTRLFQAALQTALGQINALRTGIGRPANAPERTPLVIPQE